MPVPMHSYCAVHPAMNVPLCRALENGGAFFHTGSVLRMQRIGTRPAGFAGVRQAEGSHHGHLNVSAACPMCLVCPVQVILQHQGPLSITFPLHHMPRQKRKATAAPLVYSTIFMPLHNHANFPCRERESTLRGKRNRDRDREAERETERQRERERGKHERGERVRGGGGGERGGQSPAPASWATRRSALVAMPPIARP